MIRLIFAHGWGFDRAFWNPLIAALPDYDCRHLDDPREEGQAILVGHSLGLMRGFQQRADWSGWIAINSFARFVPDCVAAAALRAMRRNLEKDSQQTLADFYNRIGATQGLPETQADLDQLRAGLDLLRDGDIQNIIAAYHQRPGLVLASGNDPLVPVAASEFLGLHHPILWHETGGHMLPQIATAWCAEAIRKMVPGDGVEPPTRGFSIRCSTS